VQYTHTYGYDQVGNRISRNDGGALSLGHGYDANNKLTITRWVGGGPPGPITANFYYDGAGNMTSVTGTEFGAWTTAYDDESRLTSVTSPAGSETFTYNALGQRMKLSVNYVVTRYVYDGDRVLEETDNAGAVLARYTTAAGSYYAPLLHLWRVTGESRFPMYDLAGSVRGLLDAAGGVTDTYTLEAFGKQRSSTGATPNPYRYGGAWGYINGVSGLQQLGARFYWPELGRFIQQDPIGDGMNWYAYAYGNPVLWIDPYGLEPWNNWEDFKHWYIDCGMGGASEWVDTVLLNGATENFGNVAGLYDAGQASRWELAKAGTNWGGHLAWGTATLYTPGSVVVGVAGRATAMGGQVARWGGAGRWVMVGGPTRLNYELSGARQLGYGIKDALTWKVERGALRYPKGIEWLKGTWGQRILR
jgi:RHS repeat-associated protein